MSAPPAWSSRQEFTREVERPDEEMNLARAALLVAREEYVQLPVERYLLRLDLLAEETRDRLGVESVRRSCCLRRFGTSSWCGSCAGTGSTTTTRATPC